jgi:dTDP-4-dehydrorhamnose reductase
MESETAVRENSPNHVIIRTAWLYGINGGNFIKSIVSQGVQGNKVLRVADDQIGSPTWANRIAFQIRELLHGNTRGTYHATSEGYCTRFECAEYVLKKLGLKASIEPCSMKDYGGLAVRPANCLLENRLLKNQGINVMQNWKDDLDAFLEKYRESLIKEAKTQKP